MILTKILDDIMDHRGEFEILQFRVGRRKADTSYARVRVIGETRQHLESMLKELLRSGATIPERPEVSFQPAPRDMVLPDGFYSTTNHPTFVHLGGEWVAVEGLMMDKHIIVQPFVARAYCKPLRLVEEGDLVVVGERGVKVVPPERPREGVGIFEFMSSTVSPEKPSGHIIKRIAADLFKAKSEGEKIVVVAGPAVVHTGASPALSRLIRLGYVDSLLSGNALAVHDVEHSLFGTSLGVNIEGKPLKKENRNHISAINEIMKAGSIMQLVADGVLTKGMFYECIHNRVPFALAGSIRDDGPIPDVITDSIEAQNRYATLVKDANIVIMLSSALHSIAVGNMLTSNTKTICVDINPTVVTKLIDRGTTQAVGIVSDIGTFLPQLASELEKLTHK
jgi:lysine-ketoglutarate reductase/saccharopine dehydrogenase-like protein (TIGR00300 family)